MAESHGNGIEQRRPLHGRHNGSIQTLEQPDAQIIFEQLNLTADGGLRNSQLGRRLGEAQKPSDGLENDQAVRRR